MVRTLVVLGQGYVGLPLARAAAAAGHTVHGYDVNPTLVDALNSGVSHVDDIDDAGVATMLTEGYRATTDPAVISGADVAVICVPTPLGDDGGPDLGAVESAARAIADNLRQGTLVVLESTSYPGTTEDVVLPILETSGLRHGQDFLLAFSPERVNPGFPEYGMWNTPKLVGGLSPEATERAVAFYSDFVATVVPLSGAKEAEMAKLLENTYRHVNIALVNEMARFCNDLGVDIWEVIRGAATKPFGFQKFTPGPGVGGHCIPIDPNYLGYEVRRTLGRQFRFVELAQEINQSMPAYVASRVSDVLNDRGKPLHGSTVLLLGVTYKPDIADQRESPAIPLAEILLSKHAKVTFHDPFVTTWHVGGAAIPGERDPVAAAAGADVVVLLQAHRSLDLEAIAAAAPALFDTRGVATGPSVVRL